MLPLAYPAGHSQLHLHLHLPPAALQRAAAPGRAYLPSRRGARTFAGARPPGSSAGAAGTETTSTSTTSGSVLSFLCPLLKLLGGGDPSQQRNDVVEVTTSSISSLARLQWGSKVATSSGENIDSAISTPTLQLYEFEACPFCRRVREAMTELDLSAEVYPCPKGSLRHRDVVKKIGGKEQFPLLVDASTGISMYESEDWLERYGNASWQDCWSFTELDGHLPSGHEGFPEGMHRQDQNSSKQSSVAPFCLQPSHYLKGIL